jgi:hypothetical protein
MDSTGVLSKKLDARKSAGLDPESITRRGSSILTKLQAVLVLCGAVALSNCSSVQLAPTSMDTYAKTFKPPSGKANVYVARDTDITGGPNSPQIVLDGTIVGTVGYDTYVLMSVDPGRHSIMAISKWGSLQEQIQAEPDNNYFIKFAWRLGLLSFDMSLEQLDEEMGKAMVRDGKRAAGTQD